MTAAVLGRLDPAPSMLGATVTDGRTRFRLFSDQAKRCQVRILKEDASPRAIRDLEPEGDGHYQLVVDDAPQGTLYDFMLDGAPYPDPYARFLPRGVFGPAEVVNAAYPWLHGSGMSRPLREQVIYEIHVGTYTPEGTYDAARLCLPELAELGVTTVELMPLSSFPGTRGWGYDGVAHFAPFAPYGTPDELRRFIDEAHRLQLSVLLDVVYNHFGPAGNYLRSYSPNYFSADEKNAWGDGPNCAHSSMRSFVLSNVRYWLTEFRFDGLRLDATHAITDPSPRHILKEIADTAHSLQPRKVVIAEDERNDPDLIQGNNMDGVWADDFHHVAHVTLTGEDDGYYASYRPGAEGLADTIRKGWLFEGEVYPATGKQRGKPAASVPADAFVYCLQNHDQVGNRALGDRLSSHPNQAGYAAFSTVLLFLPMTPLLFMGQEWAASTPFQFFTDHEHELGQLISSARREEFKGFQAFRDPDARSRIPDPQALETFTRCKLVREERQRRRHARILTLYQRLLRLRRSDPVLGNPSRERMTVEARGGLLVVRRSTDDQQRLLLANLTDQPIAEAAIASDLSGRSLLLRSDLGAEIPGPLPAWTAVVLGDARSP
jgi:maltooligosyltrehalose trehalohydrolase